jgi:hypothetical protein
MRMLSLYPEHRPPLGLSAVEQDNSEGAKGDCADTAMMHAVGARARRPRTSSTNPLSPPRPERLDLDLFTPLSLPLLSLFYPTASREMYHPNFGGNAGGAGGFGASTSSQLDELNGGRSLSPFTPVPVFALAPAC